MNIPYHSSEYKVNREAFERVVKDIENGIPLNCTMLGAIFGTPFWQLIVLCNFSEFRIKTGDIDADIKFEYVIQTPIEHKE